MTLPRATYRLQFREGMDFARAAALTDYLAQLGISHLYASPLFAAVAGSTHGYDAVDFTRFEPSIGGEAGFARLSTALDAAGLSLLLDFVPNHMAASDRNAWWRSVLEWGEAAPHAAIFDIDWSAPRLLLPVLGKPYGDAIDDGDFAIAFDPTAGAFVFTYADFRLPLTPPSFGLLLERSPDPAVAGLARDFTAAVPDDTAMLKSRLAALAADPQYAASLTSLTATASQEMAVLHRVHESQVWRLAHWRLGREALTWRRFFEITDLIGLRVDDPDVFAAVHSRLLDLIADNNVDGVRIDHIDGLAEPKSYLARLRGTMKEHGADWLLVEKILAANEPLRSNWPVDGTTGYEFIEAIAGLFVDRTGEPAMTAAWQAFTGASADFTAAQFTTKREIVERNLAAELADLTRRAAAIAALDVATRDFGPDTLRRVIVALIAALPVYRTYVDADGAGPQDEALIDAAVATAKRSRAVEDHAAIDFIARLWRADAGRVDARDEVVAFARRLQQTTGPAMAKAVEDTLFYRQGRLLALNEVGGDPARFGAPLAAFHETMQRRLAEQPLGLSATSTHDTKHGEDARARLYVLSEMPQTWAKAVSRWADANAAHRTPIDGTPVPEREVEWMYYQALAGAWPAGLIDGASGDGAVNELGGLRARMLAYMKKSVREAKLRTSWTDVDESYEAAIERFVTATLDAGQAASFLDDFCRTCRPVWTAGALVALAQTALRMTAPGVPDLYQGCELWNFSLVDPDNRAPVDFLLRRRLLDAIPSMRPEDLLADWRSGSVKMALTAAALKDRAERPELYRRGAYVPLAAAGTRQRHIVAFVRLLDHELLLTVVPRFPLALIDGSGAPQIAPHHWKDTSVLLPADLKGCRMRDLVTGARYSGMDRLPLTTILNEFPVALIVSDDGRD